MLQVSFDVKFKTKANQGIGDIGVAAVDRQEQRHLSVSEMKAETMLCGSLYGRLSAGRNLPETLV